MKKSLLALAAAGAFAGAAQAQSSVTVYGLIDYGFFGASQTAAGPAGMTSQTASSGVNGVMKVQNSGFAGNGESTSRIGFRGTEDLGGGLNAFFTLEAALATDNAGAGIFSSSAGTANRQTFVGLGKKGLGQASIGIQYTPIHEAVAATDAGGQNNVNGNVIYDRSGGWGTSQLVARSGTGMIYQSASGMGTNTSYSVRSTNSMVFKTERMSGFMGKLMLVAGGENAGQSGGTAPQNNTVANYSSNTSGFGGGIDYQWQKLFITANYQSFTSTLNQAAQTRTYAPGYNGGAITLGTNALDQQQYYAASYDFGVLKAYLQYVARKVTNTNNPDQYTNRTAQQIGVRAPLTTAVTAWASGGMGRVNNTGSNGPTANFTGWQVGTDYNLSKRTNLYAIYGMTQTSNATTGPYYGGSTNTTGPYTSPTSWNASSYAVGVRHTF